MEHFIGTLNWRDCEYCENRQPDGSCRHSDEEIAAGCVLAQWVMGGL